jgi:hypothetical protein
VAIRLGGGQQAPECLIDPLGKSEQQFTLGDRSVDVHPEVSHSCPVQPPNGKSLDPRTLGPWGPHSEACSIAQSRPQPPLAQISEKYPAPAVGVPDPARTTG